MFIGEHIIGVRIERNMYDGLLGTEMGRHPPTEIVHAITDTELPVFGLQHEIGSEHAGVTFVHFVLVVGKCAVKGLPGAYFRNHWFSKVWESSTIRRLNSISSIVDFSNL